MAVGILELTGEELVSGFAASSQSIGTITFQQLVDKFGLARANELIAEYSVDGLYMDFGGSASFTQISTEYIMSGGAPTSVVSTTETALEVAQNVELTAEDVMLRPYSAGALGTGSSTAKSVPLLSMDVGVVGAAVAPILGVALGANLYQNNPEFWTKLSQKLLPFCYPGTTEIPGWLDIVESAVHPGTYEKHLVIDKSILDAIEEWFIEEGVAKEGAISDLDTTPFSQPIPYSNTCVVGANVGTEGYYIASQTYSDAYVTVIKKPREDGWDIGTLIVSTSGVTVNYNFTTQNYHKDGTPMGSATTGSSTTNLYGSYSYDGKTVFYNLYWGALTLFDSDPSGVFGPISLFTLSVPDTDSVRKAAWTIRYGDTQREVPDGTTEWTGTQGSKTSYSKPILYIEDDPNNPGTKIVVERDGIEIALPDPVEPFPATGNLTKPENWPEDVDWPMTVDFPWPAPEGYEGDWPTEMPWPLPYERPEWWPDELQYPGPSINPSPSVDPVENPDPNQIGDPAPLPNLVPQIAPGITADPAVETLPDPVQDPTLDPTKPDTPVDTNIPDPDASFDPPGDEPVPEGETPIPVIPTIPVPFSSQNDGLISVYHPTDTQLKNFASWLWVTYADPAIEKLWNNPFDGVIALMEIYCTPTDIGAKNIRSGFLDSGISSQTISRYTEIDCGTVSIPEFYGNYLDYAPYSKCHVYLPFIGMVELNVDDIVGHAVNINYKIDEYNGSCIAQITVAKTTMVGTQEIDYSNVMYQFSGNCAVELPLAGGTQSAIRAGLIEAAAYGLSSVIGGVVSGVGGNIGGMISQMAHGAAHAVSSVVSAKSSVQHSGSFGSSFGALGFKTPYIVVTRPKQIDVVNYNQLYGFPAHAAVTIGACTGYLRVKEVNVRSSTASDDEKKLIEELLKDGVYVT